MHCKSGQLLQHHLEFLDGRQDITKLLLHAKRFFVLQGQWLEGYFLNFSSSPLTSPSTYVIDGALRFVVESGDGMVQEIHTDSGEFRIAWTMRERDEYFGEIFFANFTTPTSWCQTYHPNTTCPTDTNVTAPVRLEPASAFSFRVAGCRAVVVDVGRRQLRVSNLQNCGQPSQSIHLLDTAPLFSHESSAGLELRVLWFDELPLGPDRRYRQILVFSEQTIASGDPSRETGRIITLQITERFQFLRSIQYPRLLTRDSFVVPSSDTTALVIVSPNMSSVTSFIAVQAASLLFVDDIVLELAGCFQGGTPLTIAVDETQLQLAAGSLVTVQAINNSNSWHVSTAGSRGFTLYGLLPRIQSKQRLQFRLTISGDGVTVFADLYVDVFTHLCTAAEHCVIDDMDQVNCDCQQSLFTSYCKDTGIFFGAIGGLVLVILVTAAMMWKSASEKWSSKKKLMYYAAISFLLALQIVVVALPSPVDASVLAALGIPAAIFGVIGFMRDVGQLPNADRVVGLDGRVDHEHHHHDHHHHHHHHRRRHRRPQQNNH
jgi:hypothetical protein